MGVPGLGLKHFNLLNKDSLQPLTQTRGGQEECLTCCSRNSDSFGLFLRQSEGCRPRQLELLAELGSWEQQEKRKDAKTKWANVLVLFVPSVVS